MTKRKIILIAFLLSSCSNIPIGYVDTFQTLYKSIRNYPNSNITKEFYEDFEYSFLQAQFRGSAPVILVLSKIEQDKYYWVSNDLSMIVTDIQGRIVKSEGLDRNFEYIKVSDGVQKINLFNPDAFYQPFNSYFSEDKLINIDYLNAEVEVVYREEEFRSDIIGWNDKNEYYYLNEKPIRTNQKIHPYLPRLEIIFFYK